MRLGAQRAVAKASSFTTATKSQLAGAREHQGLRTGKELMVLGKTDRAVFSDNLRLITVGYRDFFPKTQIQSSNTPRP
jgi:hypothetical protein